MDEISRAPRSRLILGVLLLGAIGLGLGSRKYADRLSPFLAENAGDALWTVAVYLTLAFTFPRSPAWKLGLSALAISYLDEFSQLFHPPWLDALRKTLPGRLLLGTTFIWGDFVRYTAGAAVAAACDLMATRAGRT